MPVGVFISISLALVATGGSVPAPLSAEGESTSIDVSAASEDNIRTTVR
jgi:hypothetical protein